MDNKLSTDELYRESFKRNIGIVSEEEQQKLRDSRIAIAGTGGLGGICMATLARAGLGKFVISDPDTFDHSNINRQYGAFLETVGQNKVEVMKKMVNAINPSAEIKIIEGGLNQDNIPDFLEGCDLVIDSLDAYNILEMIQLHQISREKNLYVVKGVPFGFGASLLVFSPRGMSFREYFKIDTIENINPEEVLGNLDSIKRIFDTFFNGYLPSKLFQTYLEPDIFNPFSGKDGFDFKPFPSFCPAVYLCSDMVTLEAVFILLKRRPSVVIPECVEIDLHDRIFKINNDRRGV
ncbi:MAG: ThiF family adenylyltransferase [Myxococcota bacterium]|nr:ThiF family adenylyltransferase [Myxococcota bacterium]